MRIYVKSEDMKLPIILAVPTSAIGWRWIWRLVNKHARPEDTPAISEETAEKLAGEIKKYVRKNGHFDLVNIESADGERVRIRI